MYSSMHLRVKSFGGKLFLTSAWAHNFSSQSSSRVLYAPRVSCTKPVPWTNFSCMIIQNESLLNISIRCTDKDNFRRCYQTLPHFTHIPNDTHIQKLKKFNIWEKKKAKKGKEDKALAWLISENLASMCSGIDQSKRSKFSWILVCFELLGTRLWPICKPHRRTTWAGVLANSSATIFTIACSRTFFFPNGEYAWNNIYICLQHYWDLEHKIGTSN